MGVVGFYLEQFGKTTTQSRDKGVKLKKERYSPVVQLLAISEFLCHKQEESPSIVERVAG